MPFYECSSSPSLALGTTASSKCILYRKTQLKILLVRASETGLYVLKLLCKRPSYSIIFHNAVCIDMLPYHFHSKLWSPQRQELSNYVFRRMRGIQLWGSSHSLDAGADQVVTHSRLYTQAKRVNANQNQGGSPQQDQGKRGTISVSSKERVQIQRQKMRIDVLDQGDEELARK